MTTYHLNELKLHFSKHTILDLPTIQKLLPNRSRCSIFRDLRQIGYFSSYNKAGRYYTLRNTPQFDEAGIWKYCGAYFSVWGSLKNTVKNMVDNSAAGHTHLELQKILAVRVHNTLLDLVSAKKIWREPFSGTFLYTNIDSEIKLKQLKERNNAVKTPPADPYLTIEVLRAVIKYPEKSAGDIQRYIAKNGIKLEIQEVEAIFEVYKLGKKNFQ